ncbi:M35 family metallo-endopeptidase [uncultured Thiodictyon sp.]|uniref:M35 family metallo-endopeptidase n=1 Tax=uncultured Thiodictyon sp. TaxID=1846217 RepID=UPI0025ED0018|nr:M35 family metallo-endopeptidase [uncultured Thiodictyon sp.]
MIETFTDAYRKTKDIIKEQTFEAEWDKFLKNEVKDLLGDDGPNCAKASSLNKLHTDIQHPEGVKQTSRTVEADAILDAARQGEAVKLQDRAAALKTLRHLYFQSSRGAQSIWVCSLPKDYAQWPYDELRGMSAVHLKTRLAQTDEIFTSGNMKKMSVGAQDALKWCQKVLISLASAKGKDKKSRDMVSRWFADENVDEIALDSLIEKLTAGFKKIQDVCNSNQLIFSDDIVDRSTQPNLWKTTYALVRDEKLNVIYIEKVLLGRSGTKLEWAITIVHELSHREVKTKDHFYSESGLKPNAVSFPSDKAIENADNWGFYAANVNGELTKGKITTVLKEP